MLRNNRNLRTSSKEKSTSSWNSFGNTKSVVMEQETYNYFKYRDRQQEKSFINYIIGGVER